jgi:transcriptional regulator with XRE-family HTH domain
MGDVRLKVKSRRFMGREGVNRDEGFGLRLREAMRAAGIRPGELARRCGVHPVTVARWRRGELPDDLRLPQLAECLGIPLEWLKTGQGASNLSGGSPVPPPSLDYLESLRARLGFFRDQFKAYRALGISPSQQVLAEWQDLLADLDDLPPG